ncbi:MAG: acetyl-CoA carboxylase biotin carboxyl carrier protein [Planctomycetota bacterium]
MIDIRKLKELIKLMVENDLSELDLRDEQETVVLKRPYGSTPLTPAGPPQVIQAPTVAAPAPAAAAEAPASVPSPEADESLVPIVSPMVGTYYAAPDPESPPYISEGDSVNADTVVCMVEAMKVFSEIKAETSGVIEKVLIKNGEAVEFGQKLFLVRPS